VQEFCNPPSATSQGYFCRTAWIGDGTCDPGCNNEVCEYDQGDCDSASNATMAEGCSPRCPVNWLADGQCDHPCNNEACQYDRGDCDSTSIGTMAGYCSPLCPVHWLGDGECDAACNNEICDFDAQVCGCRLRVFYPQIEVMRILCCRIVLIITLSKRIPNRSPEPSLLNSLRIMCSSSPRPPTL
jgi:hypothetical protein